MNRWHYLIVLLAVGIMMTGCNDKDTNYTFNESEYYSNEQLASISSDSDSLFWIGTEYGKVCQLTDSGWKSFHVAADRIYFVRHINKNYWIGVRNGGIQRYKFDGTTFRLQQTYPIAVKQNSYSAYDALSINGEMWVCTSQGLFVLDNDTATHLRLIYPSKATSPHMEGQACVVRKIVQINSNNLVAATDNGLLHIHLPSHKITKTHEGKKIDDIAVVQGKLYVLSGNRFEVFKDGCQQTYPLHFTASSFYVSEGMFCFFSVNEAHLSMNLKTFKSIPLRRKIPINSSNVASMDKGRNAMLLVTNNALWRIPIHLYLFSSNIPIVAASLDNDCIWYVNAQNEIFVQKKGEQVAEKVYDFISEEPIIDMVVKDNVLYYVTSQRKVKRILLTKQLWRNYLNFQIADKYSSKDKITAIAVEAYDDKISLLVGIQDGLLRFNKASFRPDTIAGFNDKYISSFYQPNGSHMMYMATLNHGIIVGKNGMYEPMTKIPVVNGMREVVMSDKFPPSMIVLAGNKLFLEGSKDSLDASGISKILMANDTTVYALKDFGVQRYTLQNGRLVKSGEFFRDICFHPKASFIDHDHVYLGCNLGILHFKALHENQTKWIEIERGIISRRALFISFTVLVLILLLIRAGLKVNRHLSIRQILARKADLNTRITDLFSIYELLPNYNDEEIKQLKSDLENISPYGKVSWKNTNAQLAAISKLIMQKNRNMVLPLMKFVDTQRQEILELDLYHSKQLAQDTNDAFESGSIERIRSQAIINNQWLVTIKDMISQLDTYTGQIAGTLLLPGINENLPDMIATYRKEMAIMQLTELEGLWHDIESAYQKTFTDEALEVLTTIVNRQLHWLRMIEDKDSVVKTLTEQLQRELQQMESKDRLTLLRRIVHLDARVRQLRCLCELKENMQEYEIKRQQVIKENEERINKLFDRKLEIKIADSTTAQTKRIAQLIEILYDQMSKTDARLLNEILQFVSYDNQQARVLAILMAHAKVKRLLIPGMLQVVGNLNPVVSRLVNSKIKTHEKEILQYAERHPSSLASYILALA